MTVVKVILFEDHTDLFYNVWEVQDNKTEIIIKSHTHECVRIDKKDIQRIEIVV